MLSTKEKRFFLILLAAHTHGSFVDGWIVFLEVMGLTRTDKGQARSQTPSDENEFIDHGINSLAISKYDLVRENSTLTQGFRTKITKILKIPSSAALHHFERKTEN